MDGIRRLLLAACLPDWKIRFDYISFSIEAASSFGVSDHFLGGRLPGFVDPVLRSSVGQIQQRRQQRGEFRVGVDLMMY